MTMTTVTTARMLRQPHSLDPEECPHTVGHLYENLSCAVCGEPARLYPLHNVLGEGPNVSIRPGMFQRWVDLLLPGAIAGGTILMAWAIWIWLHL